MIGHRGAAGSAPENTLASFRRAAQLGAAWVELDVRLTRDERPVVFHDETLERCTSGIGKVSERTLDEIKALDAGGWFRGDFAGERVPTMAEAASLIAALGLGLNIEIKPSPGTGPKTARVALAEARDAWPADRPPPLVSSFDRDALGEAAEAAPDWPRGLLVGALPDDWREAAESFGCVAIHCDQRRITPEQVAVIKQAGYTVLCWTVNEAERARTLWDWCVDGVFTDFPERML